MPQISVIVPIYKVEPYLHRCVDSILAQTFTDFELILVDDGSPDNCGAICDEYAQKDSRVVVIHQENGGLSAARNAGIDWAFANSDSQWLAFVDSDDYIRPEYLERLYSAAEYENADIAVCSAAYFSDNEEPKDWASGAVRHGIFSGREACVHLYKRDGLISIEVWTKLYRKELFSDIRFPDGKIHEDQAVVPILLYSARKVVTNTESLYCYYVRESSIMHQSFSNKRFDDIEALESCVTFFRERGESEIVWMAEEHKVVLWSWYTLYARKEQAYDQVPKKYRMPVLKALRNLESCLSCDSFTWRLNQIYPWLVQPYLYWRKIKQILHISVN